MPLVNFEDQEADAPGEVPFRMDSPAPEVQVLGPASPPAWARPARVGLALTFAAAIALPVWLAFNSRNRLVDSPLDAQASTLNPAAPAADGDSDSEPLAGADGSGDGDADGSSGSADDPETADTAPDGDPADGGPSEPGRSSGSVTSTTRPSTTSTSRPSSTSSTRPSSTTTRPPTTVSTTVAPSTTAPTTVSTTEAPTTTEAPSTSASTTTTAPTTRPTTVPTTAPTTTISIPKGNLIAGGGFESPRVADLAWANLSHPNWSSTGGGIEIWATGHSGVPSFRGGQHMELNGNGPDTISQTIGVVPDLTYRWSFVHRGRRDADTVEVLIDGRSAGRFSTAPGAWRRIEGEIAVPAGRRQVQFQLRAIDAGSSGNLIDDVRFVAVG